MNENPKRKRDDEQDPTEKSKRDDHIDEAQRDKDHDDAVVDEQGEESFPASDPPANY